MLVESVPINNLSSVSLPKELFDELLSNFSSALSSRNTETIKAIWERNPLLQAWYGGQYVNFGTADVPDFRAISLDALANSFKAALSSQTIYIIKAIWERNPLLQAWYGGQYVNFGTADVPDFRVISLDALVNNFKAVLASRAPGVIKAMWERNLLLQAFYCGQYVNFETADVPDHRAISQDELVNNFKAVLASRTLYIIKAMWEGNPLLQVWYSGQCVNFGTADVPNLRIISLDELVTDFKAALSSRAPDIIKAMWEGNPLLQAWNSGLPVNYGTANVPDFRVISPDALVNNFKAVLASHCKDIIKAMWEGNLLLQTWYSGLPVNYGTANVPDFRVISLDECITNFKAALSSRAPEIIKAMWERNLLLQMWHSGQRVNFGTADVPDFRAISQDELVNNFKAALSSHYKNIIKAMWEENPLLQTWYSGQPVNFGTADVPDFRILSLEELVNDFKATLSSRTQDIIKAMWEENLLLQAWYSGQRVNFGTADVPDFRILSLDECVTNFKAALSSRAPEVIKAMWKENLLLQTWHSGLPVNFGTANMPDFRVISLEELVNNFKVVLSSRAPYIIKAMWEENLLLQAWYSGQRVNFGTADVLDFRIISLEELVNNFKAALSSQTPYIIKAIWEENPSLQAWYSGQYLNFGTANVPDFRVISLDELVNNFKATLSSQTPYIIKAMWVRNLLLQAWYSGQRVNFGTTDVPDFRVISLNELVNNFKAVLASHCKDIIKAMWEGSTALHAAIKECAFEDAVLLLKKVLASSKNGKSFFIKQYVGWVTNSEVVSAVLAHTIKRCKNKKPSTYKASQIECLESRLSALSHSSSDISKQNIILSNNTDVIQVASEEQKITNSKLKRKRITMTQSNKNSSSNLLETAPFKARPQRVEYLNDTQLNTSMVSNQSVKNSSVLFNNLNTVASAMPTSGTLFFNEQRLVNRQTYLSPNLQPSPVLSPTLFRHNCYQQKIYTFFPIFYDSPVDESSISNQSRLFINL